MKQDSYVDPSRELFDVFKALPRGEPIDMLNLVRFRDTAAYPADHSYAARSMTGAEAYSAYGAESGPIFQRVGGQVIWTARYQTMVIGPEDKHWHSIFVARYPNANAFLEMISDPAYKLAVVHRQAAVATSRLMRCAPNLSRDGTFG